jgi:hypothetical protein
MANKRFDESLREFIAEIGELDLPVFVETHRWRLHEDIQNGVAIGYDLGSPSDRKILHHIGCRYGLIALCPGDVVDLQMSNGSMTAVVRTPFGTLPVKQRK